MQISSDTYFTYDGHQSYLYGLRFAWIEDSPENVLVSEKKYSQVKNNAINNFRVAKSSYDEALEFEAGLSSDRVLIDAEVRRIYSKFFDKNQYKTLMLPVEGENIYFNCIFTNVEKIEGGHGNSYGVVGFKVTIKCDAPWGWTEAKTVTPEIDDKGKFIIRNRSDSQEYIYPKIKAKIKSASEASDNNTRIGNVYSCYGCPLITKCLGTSVDYPIYLTDLEIEEYNAEDNTVPKKAMIINTSDDTLRGTCLLCKSNENQEIVMDPQTGTITGTSGDSTTRENKVAWTNKVFVRLVPGDNIFYTENLETGDLTLEYKEARILV